MKRINLLIILEQILELLHSEVLIVIYFLMEMNISILLLQFNMKIIGLLLLLMLKKEKDHKEIS